MGSSSSSLFTPLQFTGISQYSSDFQSILSRSVSIAEIPIQQLQNRVSGIQSSETDLSAIGTAASSVQSALAALGKLGSGAALSATSSDSNVVTATVSGQTASTSYSITNVSSIAKAASETSTKSYAATGTVSSAGNMNLAYGGKNYPITLTSAQNNLAGLADAINKSGAGVTASILTTSSGNYLSVTANSTGATNLALQDVTTSGSTNFLTSTNQGSNTNFNLNGIAVSEPNNTVSDLVPGLVLNFSGTTTTNETVSLGVSTDRTKVSSALQSLASSYNTLANLETSQISTTAGTLSGNDIVYQIRSAMSQIVQYQGSGSIGNLANLGIEMSDSGVMSFNQSNFDALTDNQVAQGITLLGSATTGIGGLQNSFASITDPLSGAIATQEQQWNQTITTLNQQITTKIAQVQAMQQSLNQQLQAADASIANLASQQNLLTASITSMNYVSYGYNSNISTSKQT